MKNTKRISAVLCILMAVIFTVPVTAPESVLSETSTVVHAAAKIKLNNTKATITKGDTLQLNLKGTKKKAKWSSSNKKVASVNSNGKVTAKAKGTVTITAKLSKKQYKCKITVKNPQQQGHKHSYKQRITAPTCTEQGYTTYICSACQYSYRGNYAAALGHSYKKTLVSASKKGKGHTLYTCSRCKESYKDDYTDFQPTDAQVYSDMIALKASYPEGMTWNNSNYYSWKGGIYSGGYGCAGFAFMLSDEAFGYLPARKHTDFYNIKVGDILRVNQDTHSVIVLEVKEDSVVLAEGNYNNSIHWGRQMTLSAIQNTGTYVMTRYPE